MLKVLISAAAACMSVTAFAGPATPVDQPGVVLQPPAVYRFAVGDARVTALSDGTVPIDLHALLRGATAAETDAMLSRAFLGNPVQASINAYLVELGGRRILVDTGSGDLFGKGNGGRLPEALALAGMSADDIGDILITHVHTDHSGGLVRGGRRMFPNAVIHVGKPDVDFFLDPGNAKRTGYDARYFTEAAAMLKPYIAADQLRTFSKAEEVIPGIRAELHPGHTPGTAFYTLTSKGRTLVFVGDIVHVAAVQLARPGVTITFDQNQSLARKVRAEAFANFATGRVLIAAPHIAFPGVGHVEKDGKGYRWYPIDYANRDPAPPTLKL